MHTTREEGYEVLRAPGVILYSEDKDLLWPSYMTLVLLYPRLIHDRSGETVYVKCEK